MGSTGKPVLWVFSAANPAFISTWPQSTACNMSTVPVYHCHCLSRPSDESKEIRTEIVTIKRWLAWLYRTNVAIFVNTNRVTQRRHAQRQTTTSRLLCEWRRCVAIVESWKCKRSLAAQFTPRVTLTQYSETRAFKPRSVPNTSCGGHHYALMSSGSSLARWLVHAAFAQPVARWLRSEGDKG